MDHQRYRITIRIAGTTFVTIVWSYIRIESYMLHIKRNKMGQDLYHTKISFNFTQIVVRVWRLKL